MKRIAYCAALALLLISCGKEDNTPQEQTDGPGDTPQGQTDGQDSFTFAAVDIGLSVKWANANLGATAPEGFGDFYAWGETTPKNKYTWFTYKWGDGGSNNKLTKYNNKADFGTVDNMPILDYSDDAAHFKLGGDWRMPTDIEVDELISTRGFASYKWEWKSLNGHNGWLVTYTVNGNSIFLPAAGHMEGSSHYSEGSSGSYWSSSVSYNPYDACFLYFDKGNVYRNDDNRINGLPIRAVL